MTRKLTSEQVVAILLDERSSPEIALTYGVASGTVRSIKRGDTQSSIAPEIERRCKVYGRRLAEDEVIAILTDPRSARQIGLAYKVDPRTVRKIKGGYHWGWVAPEIARRPKRPQPKRLSDATVIAILEDERTGPAIAQHYGVSCMTVSVIKSGRSHRHLAAHLPRGPRTRGRRLGVSPRRNIERGDK
jgi:hypothetical protein